VEPYRIEIRREGELRTPARTQDQREVQGRLLRNQAYKLSNERNYSAPVLDFNTETASFAN